MRERERERERERDLTEHIQLRALIAAFILHGFPVQNGICVFWITANQTATSGVRFGTAPGKLSTTQWSKDQVQYTFRRRGYTSEWLHKVYLKGLKYDTLYYYRAGDWADGWSAVHWFRTRPKSSDPATVSMAVLADQVSPNVPHLPPSAKGSKLREFIG